MFDGSGGIMKKSCFLIAVLCGALAGAVNGFLCYAGIPSVVPDTQFSRTIILAGSIHGAILVSIIFCFIFLFYNRPVWARFLGAIACGYVSGWLSFIPIRLSINNAWNFQAFFQAFAWVSANDFREMLWVPFVFWGLVGFLYFSFLIFSRMLNSRKIGMHILIASLSGILGSLPWWIQFKPWYFSLIHGTIWGVAVGFGIGLASIKSSD